MQDRAEQIAKYVFEKVHPGACAERRQNQSSGEYDFDVKYSNGKTAAPEVTISTDENLQRTLANIKERGNYADAPSCQNSWLVEALPKCEIESAHFAGSEGL